MANDEPKLRYVILHHEGIAEPHFDLMIETAPGGALFTWRVPCWPIDAGTQLIQLGEHRRDYLEYEGPVSGNRGRVKRIAAGAGSMKWISSCECELQLGSAGLVFRQIGGEQWTAAPKTK